MEQRHAHQHDVFVAPGPELAHRAAHQRQHVGVAQLHALRVSSRPAGVHLDGAIAGPDRQVGIRARTVRNPALVLGPSGMSGRKRDDRAHGLQLGRDLLDDRIEIRTDEQQLGLRVVHHEGDLRGSKAEIHRHQHRIGFGGAEPELEKRQAIAGQ